MSASFSLTIESSTGPYDVSIATGSIDSPDLRAILNPATTIADAFFQTRPLGCRSQNPLGSHATEHEKSLDRAAVYIEQMRAAGANRATLLVSLGGGILQDIAAFIASVYMRGLPWVYIPTTVLAMVDSCIGGKSSINVGPYKNLVGTFHPPRSHLHRPLPR